MKLTKKQSIYYTEKMNTLNINQKKIYELFKQKKVTYKRIQKNIGYGHYGIRFNIIGSTFNPKMLIDIYVFLSSIPSRPNIGCFENLKKNQKNLDFMLNNGFSYSEAIQIL